MLRGFTVGCIAIASVAGARPSMAQPFTLDEKIKPTEIKLEPYKPGGKADGRMYGAVINQTQESQYFFVQGLSIYSPTYVDVAADPPTARIQVALHKETWGTPSLEGKTDDTGRWNATFKTNGDFGIHVTPDRVPATYALVVWVGNEVEMSLPSPFTKSSHMTGRDASSGNLGMFALAGLLIVAVAAAGFYKVKAARMCLLIGLLLTAPLFARASSAQDYPKAVAAMLDQLKSFLERQESVEKFWESLKALSNDEGVPDVSQRGPSLPSSCLDGTWKPPSGDAYKNCQCMATAVDKLRKNRQMLEKLRILVANQKAFVGKATALGNSFAQLHTVLGLQWVGIKKHDIDEPYAQFKTISNQKHQQLMAAIQTDLKDISECEAKLGEPDWYQKFGFVYYEFLYAAYKPSF